MLSFNVDTSNMNRKTWVIGRLRLLNKWIQLYDSMRCVDKTHGWAVEFWYAEKYAAWCDERDDLVEEYMHNMCWAGDHTFDAHGNCVRCGTHIGAGV